MSAAGQGLGRGWGRKEEREAGSGGGQTVQAHGHPCGARRHLGGSGVSNDRLGALTRECAKLHKFQALLGTKPVLEMGLPDTRKALGAPLKLGWRGSRRTSDESTAITQGDVGSEFRPVLERWRSSKSSQNASIHYMPDAPC